MYKVSYKSEVVAVNTTFKADGFNSIRFANKGETRVLINSNIVLEAGEVLDLRNRPEEVISTTFDVSFVSVDGKQNKILTIKTYYEK